MVDESVLNRRTLAGWASARLTIDGRPYINFYGSGYLALSDVPEIRNAVRRVLDEGCPFAQQVSASLGGRDAPFEAVEEASARACGTEASLYFSSGYLIGAVGFASLEGTYDLIAIDEAAHYNLIDAAKLSGRRTFTFAHCDGDSLADLLKQHVRPKQRPLVVTDGVFATTGRLPPLRDYGTLLAPYNGQLFVDESHGFGVVGEHGRGAAEYCGVAHMASTGTTLSKALCAQGAILAGSAETVARLRALPVVRGACAGSPLSATAAAASLDYVAQRPERREKLRDMTKYFRGSLRGIGLDIVDSPAPIVAFKCGTRAEMRALQRRVFDRGIHIYHSAYIGSGPEGLIRCAVFADHSREDIDALITALGSCS